MRPIDADAYEYPGDLINEPTLTLDDIVPHGRWIRRAGYDECNLCHTKTIYGSNYCPNCGAKMDLEEE